MLVAAPTGSGKTVVAEYAVRPRSRVGREDLLHVADQGALEPEVRRPRAPTYGPERVGLLTGDNAINGDAPIVVMTTEVLRNMIYAASPALRHLRFVVLDEVHYLQDPYRGPVWEEVIIHLPAPVRLVCLSATVSNAEELADWISTVRGPTTAVIEERRPVELVNLYLVGDRSAPDLHLVPTLIDGRPNPEAERLDADSLRGPHVRGRPRRRFYTPNRIDVVERLAAEEMLPAIYFIFSRSACDDAVSACIDAGIRLTTPDERVRIRSIVDQRTAALSDGDLDVLGYMRWLTGLEQGVAAHHAGMVPPFKEAVEACFAEGLVKVVFATETLALGINMPARTVVIERLTKFTGEKHEFLTPGEYTQLTGRAGRRGIDTVGHAVVLWSPFVPFDQVAGLASSRTFRLTSAFRPTYNMAANLVRRYPADEAHHLLNLSFAQYQADRAVVRLETRLEKRQGVLARLRAEARCERGDVEEYRTLRAVADEARRQASPKSEIEGALAALRPGDIIDLRGGGGQRVAVLSFANRRADSRLRVVHAAGRRSSRWRRRTSTSRRSSSATSTCRRRSRPTTTRSSTKCAAAAAGAGYRGQAAARPAARRRSKRPRRRPRRPRRTRWPTARTATSTCARSVQAERVAREVADIERQVRGYTESLARRFDRVLRLLEAWGYLDGWALTERGEVLGRMYHECDLLVAECLAGGLLDDLDPASLAGLASCFTYEHRSPAPPPAPWFPSGRVRQRFGAIEEVAQRAQRRRARGRAAVDPAARSRVLPRSPTRGRRGRASTTSSRTRTSRAATSSATSSSSSTCCASWATSRRSRRPRAAARRPRTRCTAAWWRRRRIAA